MSNQTLCTTQGLKFRWINGQCFEFVFPNGKVLLSDPYFDDNEHFPVGKGMNLQNFHVEDIERVDYLFVNHTHFDHIYNLQQVVDRFHPVVICHSAVAMELAKTHKIPLTSIYPVDFGDRYYFDGFWMDTYHGTHHKLPHDYEQMQKEWPGNDLMAMGSIYNVNVVLTTPEGMRIAFLGGNDDGMTERFREIRPNILIRNKMGSSRDFDRVAERFADIFAKANTQLLIPMHVETWVNERPEFLNGVISDMNKIMKEKNLIGRVALMERTKWYGLNLSVEAL